MKKITMILVFVCNLVFAQQMPIDFNDNQDIFKVFGGSSFAKISDPTDNTNKVGEFKNNGLNNVQGFYIDLVQPMDLSVQNNFTVSFYSFDTNSHTLTFKLENGGSNPNIEVTKNLQATTGWQKNINITFNTSTGTYNRLTIFIDLGQTTASTFLIDDINDGSTHSNPYDLDVVYDVLAWADEFDSGTNPQIINNSNWHHQTQLPSGGNWYNGEQQHYTNRIENSFMQNGMLYIRAKKESFTDQGYTKQYTSARLNSKFAFTYGRVDVRAKLPSGDGTWPAIWTLGKNINEDGGYWDAQYGTTNWPACGEIDIMEHGLHADNEVSCALHTPSSFGGTVNTKTYMLNDVANNFHVYSMNWSPNQIIFMIDGVGFYKYNPATKNANTWPFDLAQYLLLNIAMGGISGAIDPNFTQSDMVIDYVRVYQNASILNVDSVSFDEGLKIYPNPASKHVTISNHQPIKSIELISVLGKQMFSKQINDTNYLLDISTFKKGVYILRVNGMQKSIHQKLIIE